MHADEQGRAGLLAAAPTPRTGEAPRRRRRRRAKPAGGAAAGEAAAS
jgi:hypothetical protein